MLSLPEVIGAFNSTPRYLDELLTISSLMAWPVMSILQNFN